MAAPVRSSAVASPRNRLRTWADEARVLAALLRGQPRHGSLAERLDAFYRPQAGQYDRFRERLLHGRRELIARLQVPAGGHLVELGAGTGRNLLFFVELDRAEPDRAEQGRDEQGRDEQGRDELGRDELGRDELGAGEGSRAETGQGGERLAAMGRIDLVDLCPALLAEARRRTAGMANVRVIEADACTYRPDTPVDCVYFAYALTMIPDWRGAIDNALAMLRPGGQLGVVDFYVSAADPPAGLVRHDRFTRWFWPRWFAHDGVHPGPGPLAWLRECLPVHELQEHRAPVPYLPGLRVPYYLFVGRKPQSSRISGGI
ncbi:MAG: class I SAM-dependent methyltransferase [Chromatiaceae bacterium]|nr:MAG: class I SAM-dependent methyltransferase [Chromatiaceae bacterium]